MPHERGPAPNEVLRRRVNAIARVVFEQTATKPINGRFKDWDGLPEDDKKRYRRAAYAALDEVGFRG